MSTAQFLNLNRFLRELHANCVKADCLPAVVICYPADGSDKSLIVQAIGNASPDMVVSALREALDATTKGTGGDS